MTDRENALIDQLTELVLRRHSDLLKKHERARRRGQRVPPLPSIDQVLARVECAVRADLGHDCGTLRAVMDSVRLRLGETSAPTEANQPPDLRWLQ